MSPANQGALAILLLAVVYIGGLIAVLWKDGGDDL